MGNSKNNVRIPGREPTTWGVKVKKRLLDLGMKQDDIVWRLNELGHKIHKKAFSDLLYGVGVTAESKIKVIEAINAMLDISVV